MNIQLHYVIPMLIYMHTYYITPMGKWSSNTAVL